MNKFIDTHMHINSLEHTNYNELIERAYKAGVYKQILVGCERKTIPSTISTSEKYDYVYPAIGIHPTKATGKKDKDFLEKHFNKNVIAIGEIGIDLHYDDNPAINIQKESLKIQLDFAMKNNIPAIIHSRDADKETFEVISEYKYKDLKILMHSYAYGAEGLKKYIDLGCYISLSGIVTFKNAKDFKEAAKIIPLDKIVSETDSPYLAPVPHRGKTNEPAFVIDTVKYIAELRQISTYDLMNAIDKNVTTLFNI